jgi:hypothetical protein
MKTAGIYTDGEWSQIVGMLPPDLDTIARQTGALRRRRNVPDATALVRLCLAYALTTLSMKDVCAWAGAAQVTTMCGPSFFYRLCQCEPLIEQILSHVLGEGIPQASTKRRIRIVDATVITGPGSTGTDWRLHIMFDPVHGMFRSVEITDAKGGEGYARYEVEAGEIVMGDRCYSTAKGIATVVNSEAHVLVRFNPYSMRVCNLDKERIEASSYEHKIAAGQIASWDVLIPVPPDHAKGRGAWKIAKARGWIRARLVATRTPKNTVMWVLTTVPTDEMSNEEALKLYRLRWQIELLFKRLKSQLHIDELPTRNGPTTKIWILCRLLAAALAQRLVSPSGLFSPSGVALGRTQCRS